MTMSTKTIALTSANEAALTAASERLLEAASERGVKLVLLQGVRTAHEADAVYRTGGELWRIGDDANSPELDPLVDRSIDDAPERLQREVDQALHQFLNKQSIGQVVA
jgi:hypothetical protein